MIFFIFTNLACALLLMEGEKDGGGQAIHAVPEWGRVCARASPIPPAPPVGAVHLPADELFRLAEPMENNAAVFEHGFDVLDLFVLHEIR